jgi:Leucine-rich repeat (LRR) protein
VRDGYWPKWDEFVSAGIEAWKKDPDIARLYTHALGLTHVFMDGLISSSTQTAGDVEATASRELLMRALVSVYQQSPDYRELFVALGNEDDAAKIKYQQLLVLTDAQVGRLMLANRPLESLVLAGSQLTGETWQRLAAQRELEWLDLSFSNATTDDLMWLGGLLKLRRLSLEGTGIDGSLLATIGKLKTVTELDLSGCAIDDADLATLRNMQQLRVLWLTDTQISNQALATLKALPGLTYCDVSGTAISESEWDSFRQKHVGLGKLP